MQQEPGSESNLRKLAIDVDVNKIAQVIRNMVSNGLKFTKPGGSVSVCVSAVDQREEGSEQPRMLFTVAVTDTGAGISKV